MRDREPTIVDVALRAGVSKAVVSRVVNDKPGVAPETRRRILAAATDLGWTPRAHAKALSMRRTFAIGLVLQRDPRVLASDSFFPAFIAGAERALSRADYALILKVVPQETVLRQTYSALAAGRVDGVLLLDLLVDDERPALTRELRLPAVRVGVRTDDLPVPAVVLDDKPGIRAAVRHLHNLGHRRIAHVSGDLRMVHGRDRLHAWREEMAHLGLSDDLVETTDFSAAAARTATERLLDAPQPPTAIVYASDGMAVAGMSLANDRGLRLPVDLSVVGFDDTELAAHLHPALTTVRGDIPGWGEACVDTLLALVGTSAVPADRHLPPAELIVRSSTSPPQQRGGRPSLTVR